MLVLLLMGVWSQSNITGNAAITLVDAGSDCSGAIRVVDIFADVVGMTGDGGDVGINAFVVALTIEPGYLCHFAFDGEDPIHFTTKHTDITQVAQTTMVVGYAADSNAPNANYRLARLWINGEIGSFSVTVEPITTSLGSRVVGGFGPDAIPFTTPPASIFDINNEISLLLADGVAQWLADDPIFDIAPPVGAVDILDLVKLTNCTVNLVTTDKRRQF